MIRDAFREVVSGRRFLFRMLRWTAIGVAIYAVLGFLIAPVVLKWQLTKQLTQQLARDVSIEKISINPFALSVRIRGFLAKEPYGENPAVRFEELYLNLSSTSLYRFAPVLDEIRLVRPEVRIVRNADKSYNYTDLIRKFTANPAPPKQAEPPPRFSVNNIEVIDGRVDFDDRPEGKQHAISEIQIGIPFISSLSYATDINVKPAFFAKVNGTPIFLKGETKPFKNTQETTLNLTINAFDLPRYADYSPVPLSFRLQRGVLDAHYTFSLMTRDSMLDTLAIFGNFTLKDLQVSDNDGEALAAFDSLTSAARFSFSRQGSKQEMKVSDGSATLTGLRIEDASRRRPLLEAGEVKLADIRADLDDKNLVIGEFAVDRMNIQLARYRDGSFSYKHLTAISTPEPEAPGRTTDTPWKMSLKHLAVKNTAAQFDDQLPGTPAKTALTAVTLEARDLSNSAKSQGDLRVDANLNKQGRIEAAGKLGFAPPSAELMIALRNIALIPFQPYIEDNLNIVVTQGALSGRGRVAFSSIDSNPAKLAFRGDVSLRRFVSLDKTTDQELLKWQTLTLSGVEFDSIPLKLGVKEIALSDFYSRLIVNSDATLNLQTLMRPDGAAAPPHEGAPVKASDTKQAADIRIGKIAFSRGNVNFSDYFVKPNTTANLTDISGSVSELTPDTAGDVMLTGQVNGTSPIDINGRVNPLAKNLFLDIRARARDIELSPMSPYTVKYAGYNIEKGKLSLQLKYFIEDGRLSAENNINLDQLTFGEKIDSPDATKLPILLAVSLLKDRNGVIDLKVPVSGSLNDPKFSLGKVIVQVIVNLITKALTSPFALLGAAFGGSEELHYVDFAPGRSAVAPDAESKLKTLAKALEDRPGLKMDIAGRVDPQPDREGIKRFSVERKVKMQKLKETAGRSSPADLIDDIVVDSSEYEKYLTAAYKAEKFSKPRNFIGISKSLPVPEMEQLMLANEHATDEDLRLLANGRAQAVKDWLVRNGQVPAERLFLTAPRIGTENMKDKGSPMRAEFTLK